MPTFETPDPITSTSTSPSATVRITASDATRPSSRSAPATRPATSDVKMAEQTRVDYADGALMVKAPKPRPVALAQRRRLGSTSRSSCRPAPDVHGDAGAGRRCTPRAALGDSRYQDRARRDPARRRPATLRLNTGAGDITRRAGDRRRRGHHRHGRLRIGAVERHRARSRTPTATPGSATAGGDLRVNSANGEHRGRPARRPTSSPKTANGDVRLRRGRARLGRARDRHRRPRGRHPRGHRRLPRRQTRQRAAGCDSALECRRATGDRPAETVEVRGRTSVGTITIRQAA